MFTKSFTQPIRYDEEFDKQYNKVWFRIHYTDWGTLQHQTKLPPHMYRFSTMRRTWKQPVNMYLDLLNFRQSVEGLFTALS